MTPKEQLKAAKGRLLRAGHSKEYIGSQVADTEVSVASSKPKGVPIIPAGYQYTISDFIPVAHPSEKISVGWRMLDHQGRVYATAASSKAMTSDRTSPNA